MTSATINKMSNNTEVNNHAGHLTMETGLSASLAGVGAEGAIVMNLVFHVGPNPGGHTQRTAEIRVPSLLQVVVRVGRPVCDDLTPPGRGLAT